MALFRRRRPRFPADMVARLEMLGRYEMDPMTSDIDGGEVASRCIVPFYDDATQDPDGFVADLRALVSGDTGGFATYGAPCLVRELLSGFSTPGAAALLDAGIEVKRTFRLPPARLKGYEWQRWCDVHGPGAWWD